MTTPAEFTQLDALIREKQNTPSFHMVMRTNVETILAALALAPIGLAGLDYLDRVDKGINDARWQAFARLRDARKEYMASTKDSV